LQPGVSHREEIFQDASIPFPYNNAVNAGLFGYLRGGAFDLNRERLGAKCAKEALRMYFPLVALYPSIHGQASPSAFLRFVPALTPNH